jgi:hypothetical protein
METERLEAQDQVEVGACRNCGGPVGQTFCSACGEKIFVPGEHSLKHFMGDVLNAITFLDTKFLRTLKLMLTRPGAMSYQYVNGKRVSFIKPMSMFFIANLIYFLFPLYNSLNSPLNNQMYQLPHSRIAERMVKEEVKTAKTDLKTFEVAYNQQSTNMAKMVLFLLVLYFSLPLALVNYSKKLFYYDHLMICLELFSLIILVALVAIPWLLYFFIWVASLAGKDISFVLDNSVSSWILGTTLFYLIFCIEREAYSKTKIVSLSRAAILVALFIVALQSYRASLFFITFWTM